ncbi:MAG: class I SAM-dependent methyltransferase [Acidobacteriia bacterium]|nr:class I SAM-dependent methyltransferase [Terriglobia bacterium]
MREDWDQRARENAEYYIHTGSKQWDEREFFRSGEINVANEIMTDMASICGGNRSPLDLDALEIGCGVGRMTKMMARIFRHVTAVDVSAEMIQRAKTNLSGLDNVNVVLGDGATLSALKDASYDFAFSFIVFQHIPTVEVVASYCREVYRVLRPGALFKFQLQGVQWNRDRPPDTWHGISFSEDDSRRLCQETGFIFERSDGVGSNFYWLWFRKPD